MIPIKVLLVAPYHPTKVGGIGTWTKNILDYCSDRHDIQLVFQNTVNNLPKRRSLKNKLFHIFIGCVDSLLILVLLFWNIIIEKPDIVHYTSSASYALYKDYIASVICKIFKVPFVIHWRFGRIPDLCKQRNREYRALIKVIKNSSSSIVIDKLSYKALEDMGLIDKVCCIPNPISPKLQTIAQEIVKIGSTNVVRNKGEILFVGHILKTKGVSELVSAIANTKEIEKLTLVGPFFDEVYKQELTDISSKRDSGKWLNIVGELKREDVFNYFLSCGIFCLPSYTEGFPNVIIEAMAHACPIVATKVGAIPEMLEDNCGTVIVPENIKNLEEALVSMVNNYEESINMGKNACNKVLSLYTLDKVFSEYYNLWSKLLSKNGNNR